MRHLYAFATEQSGPSKIETIDLGSAVRTPLAAPGLRLRGGLAFRPSNRRFYSFADPNPGLTFPRLVTLDVDGVPAEEVSIDTTFTGGLAYRPAEDGLFAIRNVVHPDLARIHRVNFDGTHHERFQLGQMRFGGMVYVKSQDAFYAIGTDRDNFSWLVFITLQGRVDKIQGLAQRGFGGLAYAPHDDHFYFVANDAAGNGTLHRRLPSGEVQQLKSMGKGFDVAGLSIAPWYGASIRIKSPLPDDRAVAHEPVRLEAEVVDVTGQKVWDSTGVSWYSIPDGPLGTGAPTARLRTPGTQTIMAEVHGLSRGVSMRVFPDLWQLYRSRPSQGEIDRILRDFTIHWDDGPSGTAADRWASFPGFPFDQNSQDPSRTAVIAKLDLLRHQHFSEPPFSAPATLYEHVKRFSPVIRASLGTALNQAGGGTMHLNRGFALWSNMLPYIHNLYLLLHENRHNEPGDPLHTSCTGWDGSSNPPGGADASFEPGSGYSRAALYLFWVYKYGLFDPPNIKAEARNASLSQKGRFCTRPASSDPRVQALLVELWGV